MRRGNFFIPLMRAADREISRILCVKIQTLLTPIIRVVIYLLVFGMSIDTLLVRGESFSYDHFLVPGLLAMNMIMNGFENGSSSIISNRFQGEMEMIRITPMSGWQFLWGTCLGTLFRVGVISVGTWLLSCLYFLSLNKPLLSLHHTSLFLLFSFLGTITCNFLGICVSLFAKNFDQVNSVNTFILMPMVYLGGVFFPISRLPQLWQWVARGNPLFYFINGIRHTFFGLSDASPFHGLWISGLFCLITYLAALFFVEKGNYQRW